MGVVADQREQKRKLAKRVAADQEAARLRRHAKRFAPERRQQQKLAQIRRGIIRASKEALAKKGQRFTAEGEKKLLAEATEVAQKVMDKRLSGNAKVVTGIEEHVEAVP